MTTAIENGNAYRGSFLRSNAERVGWYADAKKADALEPEIAA